MTNLVKAILHKDNTSAFGLTFPDLPGCFAASDTSDGIPTAAKEALDLWHEQTRDLSR
ncbi:type II toxin-antitoxin system HicB family antitoxin [Falsirhodobacter halotolerans]|uniref:type II toxin-antitoxin system HicB family antitoxin n=1 Tax=Falsirhodobacter halotolerans TaxID=1146892 RepID=UPI001FD22BE0|nr:type II toxin-antitoxin system HicB family antitoxin [Falsirhodobacter halotolerans]MCJ8139338.1 type II toxin-antitoxin system HicB family antitoxin [Falsirhodobacter halotolerans]